MDLTDRVRTCTGKGKGRNGKGKGKGGAKVNLRPKVNLTARKNEDGSVTVMSDTTEAVRLQPPQPAIACCMLATFARFRRQRDPSERN